MATQGLLAQSKPAANTDTVLYSGPVDSSASTVLTVANDGTGSAFDVGIKDYSQKLTLDASTYKLHKGDIISRYQVDLNTATPLAVSANVPAGQVFTSADKEKTMKFESYLIPTLTTFFVKVFSIRQVTLEMTAGGFAVGDAISKGTSPNDTTGVVYDVFDDTVNNLIILQIGPSTLNGTGTEFGDGDSVNVGTNGAGTISTGGVGTANNEFCFSTTTAGGVYKMFVNEGIQVFTDRTYRFDLADATMSGRDFKISVEGNGEWGPDGVAGTLDDGTEYTTGKTSNGTAGSAGAYVQYDLSANANPTAAYYYYDGGTGTAANANYGGSDRTLVTSTDFSYNAFWAYDLTGTWVNGTDTFTFSGTTYTVSGQTAGAYGYVRDYTGTTLTFIKGVGSPDFAGTETFYDVPSLEGAERNLCTVSSVDVASAALEVSHYIAKAHANAANNVERITSIVVGPGETVVINSATQNNVFNLIGFEDTTTSFPTKNYVEGSGTP